MFLERQLTKFSLYCAPIPLGEMQARQSSDEYDEPPPSANSSSTSILSAEYTPLSPSAAEDALVDLAHPYTGVLDLPSGRKADGLSFQPCAAARCQDRYIIEQFAIRGAGDALWTLTGVFDGHLGETTVEHVAHHLPVIVQEFLERAVRDQGPTCLKNPTIVSTLLKRAFSSFDRDIANDVLKLFPGGVASLDRLSDDYIRSVINDYGNGLTNYKKVQLNMYGTTALLALVDPRQENLWIANLGDCQAGELLTEVHNGSNPREVDRVRREHPSEPDCIKNGRILGTIAPFRCLGDQPFKQPAAFTRRILFNLDTGAENVDDSRAAWAQLIDRVLTPPYLSADADVVHVRLDRSKSRVPGVPNQFLILCTDGLPDLLEGVPSRGHAQYYVDSIVEVGVRDGRAIFDRSLGGEDSNALSQMIACAIQNAARTSSLTTRQTLALQSRFFSSSTPLGENAQPSSSSSPQIYLNEERKRKLISIYHQAEHFITHENLSDYVDREFMDATKFTTVFPEDGRAILEGELKNKRERPKLITVQGADVNNRDNRWFNDYNRSQDKDKGDKIEGRDHVTRRRLKAAVFGVDDSSQAAFVVVYLFEATIKFKGRDALFFASETNTRADTRALWK
ncbi:protein serine/threonine phosphatase 2C [Fomitiporia mediterranea MF3/22]|uniref:protein serine/threonine phosphatase 2C n=1 Tax=Fomitiporia mediterranea (strain MF3/22) TaxID=694068 RepID=UPI00044076F6|nr:protein serine/threonine phosphatase 2C [Fomitiporia mediterranea MF3/22]EJD00916.1 protein serine/threonine phosphatase 2C [Fomitiporia mediterranea MF3/22]